MMTKSTNKLTASVVLLVAIASFLPSAHSFASSPTRSSVSLNLNNPLSTHLFIHKGKYSTQLYSEEDDSNEGEDNNDFTSNLKPEPILTPPLGETESTLLGVSGLIAANIMLYSESVLFQTGCGLPAGPGGLVGAAEGVSYLGVVGLVGFSLYTKNRTGYGLTWNGALGGAERLAYLALAAGVVVLIAQVVNYGYIPNAVPMEGAMCK